MKALATLLAVLVLTASLSAQVIKKGEMVGQVGIGYGVAGIYGSVGFPPITAGLQYGIEDKISIGGLVAYSSSSDSWGFGKWSYSYLMIGARGEYHFLENVDKVDAYGGATLGYNIVSSSATYDAGYDQYRFNASASGSYMLFGVHGGAKYYFTPQIGVFAELGYGVSYFTAGIAFKL